MIDALLNEPNYVAAKKMLDATLLRHDAIASNLAHVESPNYKRLDVAPTFAQSLQQAIAAKDANRIQAVQAVLAEDKTATAHGRDGNTVQLETELAALSQNAMEHSLETRLVTGALLRMRLAVTGRPV